MRQIAVVVGTLTAGIAGTLTASPLRLFMAYVVIFCLVVLAGNALEWHQLRVGMTAATLCYPLWAFGCVRQTRRDQRAMVADGHPQLVYDRGHKLRRALIMMAVAIAFMWCLLYYKGIL